MDNEPLGEVDGDVDAAGLSAKDQLKNRSG